MELELFDRQRALACFGSEAVLQQVMQQFLGEAGPMIERLRGAVASGDQASIRQAIHWFKGGLVYLFSPAAEQAWTALDLRSREGCEDDLGTELEALVGVIERLKSLVLAG